MPGSGRLVGKEEVKYEVFLVSLLVFYFFSPFLIFPFLTNPLLLYTSLSFPPNRCTVARYTQLEGWEIVEKRMRKGRRTGRWKREEEGKEGNGWLAGWIIGSENENRDMEYLWRDKGKSACMYEVCICMYVCTHGLSNALVQGCLDIPS